MAVAVVAEKGAKVGIQGLEEMEGVEILEYSFGTMAPMRISGIAILIWGLKG